MKKFIYIIVTSILFFTANSILADNSAVFIVYHRFNQPKSPSTDIQLSDFDAQIQELKQGGYHVLPLLEIIKRLRTHQSLPDKTVAILIDDGYESAYKYAWPRLKKAGFPFTLFIYTDPIDKGYHDFMTWSQLKELKNDGVDIENHTASHPHLAFASEKEIKDEILKPQKRFQEKLGIRPTLFAYPYGEYPPRARQILIDAGFTAAFVQEAGVATYDSDFYTLPRFAFSEHFTGLNRFRQIVSAMAMNAKNITPSNRDWAHNPLVINFNIANQNINLDRLSCFASQQGKIKPKISDSNKITLVFPKRFHSGLAQIHCVSRAKNGRLYWLGIPYAIAK